MMVARMVRRKISTTSTTSPTASTSVNCTSRIEARIVSVRSCTTVSFAPTGRMRRRRGSSLWMFWTVCTTFAPGWRRMSMMTAWLPLCQPETLAFSSPSIDLGDVAQHHGVLVAIGDDQRAVGFGGGKLVVRRDGVGLERAVERALRARHVGVDDRLADVFEREAVGREPRQIGLDAHRRLDAALRRHIADAGDLGEPLRQQRVGKIAQGCAATRSREVSASVTIGVSAGFTLE